MMDTPPQASKEMKEYLRREIDRAGGHGEVAERFLSRPVNADGEEDWSFSKGRNGETVLDVRNYKAEVAELEEKLAEYYWRFFFASFAFGVMATAFVLLLIRVTGLPRWTIGA